MPALCEHASRNPVVADSLSQCRHQGPRGNRPFLAIWSTASSGGLSGCTFTIEELTSAIADASDVWPVSTGSLCSWARLLRSLGRQNVPEFSNANAAPRSRKVYDFEILHDLSLAHRRRSHALNKAHVATPAITGGGTITCATKFTTSPHRSVACSGEVRVTACCKTPPPPPQFQESHPSPGCSACTDST